MATKNSSPKTKKEAVVEVEEAVKAPVPEDELLMYVGPTLTKYGVIQNVIYNGLPSTALTAIDKIPLFKGLFIDPKDYPSAEQSIREQTGFYWAAYQSALNYKEEN